MTKRIRQAPSQAPPPRLTMGNILEWEASRSWTGKADLEDIINLRNDLAALQRLIDAKADQDALHTKVDLDYLTPTAEALAKLQHDLEEVTQQTAEVSRQLHARFEKLEQSVIVSVRNTDQAAAKAQTFAEQSFQTMGRLAAETFEQASAAKALCQETQAVCARQQESKEQLDHEIEEARSFAEATLTSLEELSARTEHRSRAAALELEQLISQEQQRAEQTGVELRQFAHETRQSIERTCHNTEEQVAQVIHACDESKRIVQHQRQLAHELATKTEIARQIVQSSEALIKSAQEHAAEAVIACEESRGNLSRQTNLIAAFEEKANAKQELMVTIERNSKRNEETVSHLAEEIQKQHADIARTRTELLELAGSLSKLKGFVVEAADQCRRCTATTENTMKQASELLEASAGQLKECEDALQNTQETQVGQEELARRIKEHLKQADSYRLQLKSFALKTEVHVAKFQQGSRSFLGRLRWLFRGVSE